MKYQDVLSKIMVENKEYYKRRHSHLVSWLRTNSAKRSKYLEEVQVVTCQLDSTGPLKEQGDLEDRLSSLRTAILTLEQTIKIPEAQLELCRAHEREPKQQHEAPSPSNASSSLEDQDNPHDDQDHAEGAEAAEAAASEGNLAVTPEEERMLLDSEDPGVGESPTAAVVMGGMARMQVSAPLEAPAKGGEASTETTPPAPTQVLHLKEETSE